MIIVMELALSPVEVSRMVEFETLLLGDLKQSQQKDDGSYTNTVVGRIVVGKQSYTDKKTGKPASMHKAIVTLNPIADDGVQITKMFTVDSILNHKPSEDEQREIAAIREKYRQKQQG